MPGVDKIRRELKHAESERAAAAREHAAALQTAEEGRKAADVAKQYAEREAAARGPRGRRSSANSIASRLALASEVLEGSLRMSGLMCATVRQRASWSTFDGTSQRMRIDWSWRATAFVAWWVRLSACVGRWAPLSAARG